MNCCKCKNPIIPSKDSNGKVKEARYKLVALESPYMNLMFHPECLLEVDNLIEFLIEYLQKEYKITVNAPDVV